MGYSTWGQQKDELAGHITYREASGQDKAVEMKTTYDKSSGQANIEVTNPVILAVC